MILPAIRRRKRKVLRMGKRLSGILTILAVIIFSNAGSYAAEYTLGSLYRQALKNSEKIKFAEENLYIARTGKDKAWALLIPKLTAYGTYNRYTEQKVNIAGTLIQPNEAGNWGVRMDESFSLSVRELNALNIARQSITKSEHDLDATKSDFVLAVAAAYYDVLKAKKFLEVAAANLERLTQYRNSVAKRVEIGELTRTALLRADGELSGARSGYLQATNAFKLARAMLVRITGIEDDFRLKESPAQRQEHLALSELRATAFDLRSDLKSFEVQKKIAREQIEYARGAFWPNIGLFAIYSGADQSPATASLNRESTLAGVSLTFPFFEGGLRMAEFREAKAREKQARLSYDDFKKNVEMELQSAYLDLQTQEGILSFLEDQRTFADDNYNSVIRMFNNGLATSLDVMDANALLLSAEKNVNEAAYNYQMADLKLKRTSGTLLQFVNADK